MPGCVSLLIRKELAVLGAHGNQKLIDAHGCVDSDLAAEERLDVMFLSGAGALVQTSSGQGRTGRESTDSDSFWSVLSYESGQALDAHSRFSNKAQRRERGRKAEGRNRRVRRRHAGACVTACERDSTRQALKRGS
jgi:hypothetical protein